MARIIKEMRMAFLVLHARCVIGHELELSYLYTRNYNDNTVIVKLKRRRDQALIWGIKPVLRQGAEIF